MASDRNARTHTLPGSQQNGPRRAVESCPQGHARGLAPVSRIRAGLPSLWLPIILDALPRELPQPVEPFRGAGMRQASGSPAMRFRVVLHGRIPLSTKLWFSLYMALFAPIYLHYYGLINFLYFCDIALLLSFVGIWFENPVLISMCAVGILLPQFIWIADFAFHLVFDLRGGWTQYMFNAQQPLFLRLLSLFHGWLPFLLLYLMARLGYDRRALLAWTAFACTLILVCYFVSPLPTPHAAELDLPSNINFVFGLSARQPQAWAPSGIYLMLELLIMFGMVSWPTHWVLKRIFPPPGSGERSLPVSTGWRRPQKASASGDAVSGWYARRAHTASADVNATQASPPIQRGRRVHGGFKAHASVSTVRKPPIARSAAAVAGRRAPRAENRYDGRPARTHQ